MERIRQMEVVQDFALQRFKEKNADYSDSFEQYGLIGILMRIQRALSITKNGVNIVEHDEMRDTLLDLQNYAAMGVMLVDGDIQSGSSNQIEIVNGTPDQYGRKERWRCPRCNELIPGNLSSWGWTKCNRCPK
jgi:glutaredoxin-related protein